MNTKAFLFDFDGTLADTLPFYVKAYRKALTDIGFPHFQDKDIVSLCFGKKEQVVCDTLGVSNKVNEFSSSYFQAVRELFPRAQLLPGARELLMTLKEKQIKSAIITFAYRWYIDSMVEQYSLENLVDQVISADDVTHPKPHPEAVLKVCSTYLIQPNECVVVGDSKSDILMAKSAGASSILVHLPSYDLFYNLSILKQSKPDKIINSLSEIIIE